MSNVVDISEFVFNTQSLPDEGANIRVRPSAVRAVTFGQGDPLPGPKLQEIQFVWASPLKVDNSCENGIGDPEAGRIHLDTIAQTPELFMSEENYHKYINLLN